MHINMYKTKEGANMKQIELESDIIPLSEFRANTAKFVKQINETKRPLILTQHGKSTAVLLDVASYQALIEKIELLQDIQISERQIKEGKFLTHDQVKQELLERYQK